MRRALPQSDSPRCGEARLVISQIFVDIANTKRVNFMGPVGVIDFESISMPNAT
jgi:hypothetical protein